MMVIEVMDKASSDASWTSFRNLDTNHSKCVVCQLTMNNGNDVNDVQRTGLIVDEDAQDDEVGPTSLSRCPGVTA